MSDLDFGDWAGEYDGADYVDEQAGGGVEYWRLNASKGYFEQQGKNATASAFDLTGCILQMVTTRTFFAPNKDINKEGWRLEKAYNFPNDKPLCQYAGGTHPVVIHDGLNDKQRKRLSDLQCGDCNKCKARWKLEDKDGEEVRPHCQEGIEILFLPDAGPDADIKPMILRISAWLSVRAIKEWFFETTRVKKIPPYAGKVKLTVDDTTNSKGANVKVLGCNFVAKTPREMLPHFNELMTKHDITAPRPQLGSSQPAGQLPAAADDDDIPF